MNGSEPIFCYQLKIVVIIILTLMLLGVGAPWHADPAVYGLLGALSAFTGLLKRVPQNESINHLASEPESVSVLGFRG